VKQELRQLRQGEEAKAEAERDMVVLIEARHTLVHS
jgi:hypothetical protein